MNNEPVAYIEAFSGKPKLLPEISYIQSKHDILLYIHPAKTLTDEEIDKVMKQTKNWYEFARAILRKAQEK